jgi:4-diphosphocytidyl-2-C-methyl-D-erythritol kinase
VFHTIGLCDRLTLEDAPEGVHLTCTEPDLDGPDNLAARAARRMAERYEVRRGVRIHLEKAIPAGAGLGGGSSDAAAVVTGLNRLWGLERPIPELAELGAGLGSDVPFFVHVGPEGGAARVEGRGERVTPLEPLPDTWCLLVHPGVTVSTARVFAAHAAEKGGQALTPPPAASIIRPAPTGIGAGVPAPQEPALQDNDLEAAACRVAPEIADALDALRAAGGEGVRMTGSGAAVFCLASSRSALARIQERLKPAPRWKVWLVPLTGAGVPRQRDGC